MRLKAQRSNDGFSHSKLTESEVAEHRADVFVLVVTTKLFELDHRLGQLAGVLFLTWHIDRFCLGHYFTNNISHFSLSTPLVVD